jgi:hypothetical protein
MAAYLACLRLRARVRAALRAAAERPAAPLVRAALRAASDRSAAVRDVRRAAVPDRRDSAERDVVLLAVFFTARDVVVRAAVVRLAALLLPRAGVCLTLRAFAVVRLSGMRPPPAALRRDHAPCHE